jgi:plasmid stabilization system protein ParE
MNYAIRYTPEALRDMDEVWEGVYAASRSYDIADRYVTEFVDTIAAQRMFPFSGIPLEYRGLFTGFYSVNFKKYKAFYRVRDGYVEVLRIMMAKRDYLVILFGEPEEMAEDF